MKQIVSKLEQLIDIGIALSAESSHPHLLERILESACGITHADGGTIYSATETEVKIEILRSTSLKISYGGTSDRRLSFAPIPLHKPDNSPNLNNVVTYAINKNTSVNIANSYDSDHFDFSGTRAFDRQMGYHSISFLTVPLRNHEQTIIGALQLINALDPETNKPIPFDPFTQRLVEALASQAAIALTKEQLIRGMKQLFESLIKLIADAIDKKSPYTGGHCRRVPEITMALADAIQRETTGPFSKFKMNSDERYELEIASWLHDCGKIVTPEHIVDKSSKLQTIFDRIDLIKTRMEVVKRDLEIAFLKKRLEEQQHERRQSENPLVENSTKADSEDFFQYPSDQIKMIDSHFDFLKQINTGIETLTPADMARIHQIAAIKWHCQGQVESLLNENEIYNLLIPNGTLNAEERQIIKQHIDVTIDMLTTLPFPRPLRKVPDFAGAHHEHLDGRGYPKGLTKDHIALQSRMIALADVFEALTAKDRPFKLGKKLSEALKIMAKMCKDQHLDSDLFQLFITQRIYLAYAKNHLDPDQIDEVRTEDLF